MRYQCPQSLCKAIQNKATGGACSPLNRLWFLPQGPNIPLIFILVSDKVPLPGVLSSHFWPRLVVLWNQATALSTGLNANICIYHASGKPACERLVPPSWFLSECLTPEFGTESLPLSGTETKALFSAKLQRIILFDAVCISAIALKCPAEANNVFVGSLGRKTNGRSKVDNRSCYICSVMGPGSEYQAKGRM